MRIRLTQERDLPAIDQIFALGRERQHSEGNYSQWREDYPTIAVVREDIKNGTGFVCTAWALCQAMGLGSSSCNLCKRTTLICGSTPSRKTRQ